MRISDWSSDVCSSDLERLPFAEVQAILARADIVFCHGGTGSLVTGTQAGCHVIAMPRTAARGEHYDDHQEEIVTAFADRGLIQVAKEAEDLPAARSEEHTSELQSLMRISYAVFCFKKKIKQH